MTFNIQLHLPIDKDSTSTTENMENKSISINILLKLLRLSIFQIKNDLCCMRIPKAGKGAKEEQTEQFLEDYSALYPKSI